MKVELKDLENALNWIKKNTNAGYIEVQIDSDRWFRLKTEDKYNKMVEIEIYGLGRDGNHHLSPRIKKTEVLKGEKDKL